MNGSAGVGGKNGQHDVAEIPRAESPDQIVPERPHMPEPIGEWLELNLAQVNCFLEYGSGGSTRLAAAIGVPHIVSIESDRAYADAVRTAVEASGTESRCDVIHADIGRTKAWGYPVGLHAVHRWPSYCLAPWDFIRANPSWPDLILIDGRFRVACLLASLLEARPGTKILFDDYRDRPTRYSHAEKFLAPAAFVDRAAIFVVPEKLPLRAIARALARFAIIPH